MVTQIQTLPKYQEVFVSGQQDATAILHRCLKAGIFQSYVLYEGKGEVRIAGNQLARVLVTRDTVQLDSGDRTRCEPATDPFKQVGELLGSLPLQDWTAYGYVSFDMARFYSAYSKAIAQPLLYFIVPETELRVSAEGVLVRTLARSLEPIQTILAQTSEIPTYTPLDLTQDFADCADYSQRIEQLIGAIQSDRLHKAIISRSKKLSGNLDVLGTYVVGSQANNSARSYCLQLEDVRAVGFSPEILMEVHADRTVITNPLAGTRPRSDRAEDDARLYDELFRDAKEVKEHALSIWLAQSELDSFCLPETVRVFNFMEVKKYRCVQHLSSRVGGQLRAGKTLWDALTVLFPGITVSGIDKSQALEWIDRLEDEPRGIYAGSIGWVDSQGLADMAIAIRSVYQYGSEIYLNAGAGIVGESIPQREYVESVNKMNTMLTNVVLEA